MSLSNKINLKIWAVVIVALLCCPVFLYALPQGENVIEGSVTFDRSEANTLKVNVASEKAIIDYNNFSIAANESVYFFQPSVSAAALNRVTGSDASSIFGNLNANGIIYLINPHGINIGANANINAAGLIASTLNISNVDFLAGRNNFFKDGESAFILNQGNIIIRNGGYVALLSQAVENQGTIIANLGTVVMAAGEKMILVALDDLNQISVVIDEGVKEAVFGPDGRRIDSAVKNSGTITANGGKVILTAKVLNKVFDYAVNNTGVVEAKSLVNNNGVIELKGEGAAIVNSGTLNAGTVNVEVKDAAFINKGKVISEAEENIVNSGNITIQANSLLQGGSIIADKLVSVTADKIDVFIKDNPLAVEVDPLLNTSPAVIMQAPEVKVIARQFGSSDAPVNINAPLTYIYRTSGDINILDSLGIGTSILLRGPPDGFGAIIYNRDTNLTLEASQVTLSGSAPIYLYGNITFSNLTCTVPGKIITFEAGTMTTIEGLLTLEGAPGNNIILQSSETGEGNEFKIYINAISDAEGNPYVNYITVSDSDAYGPAVPVQARNETIADRNNTGWDANRYWVNGTGAWNSTAHWSTSTGGSSGASVPDNNDNVYFDSSSGSGAFTVSLDQGRTVGNLTMSNADVTIACGTYLLTVGGNLTVDGTISGSGGVTLTGNNKTIDGTGSITNTGTFAMNNNMDIASTAVLSFSGTINIASNKTVTNNGNVTTTAAGGITGLASNSIWKNAANSTLNIVGPLMATGTLTANANPNTINYNGTTTQTIKDTTYYILKTNNTAGTTLGGATTVTTLTIGDVAGSSIFNDGGFVITPGASSVLNISNSGTYNLGSATVGTSWPAWGTVTMASGTTVGYVSAVAQTISVTPTYQNLTISGAGTKMLGGAITVNGNLTLAAGTLDVSASNYGINLSGNWINNGGSFTSGSGTVTFNSTTAAQAINGTATTQTFNSITVNKSGQTLSVGGSTTALTLNGTLTLTAGTFTAPATISIVGDWTNNNGNFNANSGTVTFDGQGNEQYIISGGSHFNNLVIGEYSDEENYSQSYVYLEDELNVNGNLNIKPYSTLYADYYTDSEGNDVSSNINIGGNWNNQGAYEYDTSYDNTVTFNGNVEQSITSGESWFYNLTINNSSGSSVKLNDALNLNADLTITSGTLDLNGNSLEVYEDFYNAGTLKLLGTEEIDWNGNDTEEGTVEYDGTGATGLAAGYDYYNLTFTGTGSYTLYGNSLTVNNDLSINSGVLDVEDNSLTVNGALNINGGTLTAADGTIDANGDVNITDGMLTAPTSDNSFTVFGNWNKTGGTFDANSGTVTFDGTEEQSITSDGSAFYNLINSNGGSLTLILKDTLNIDGDLTIDADSTLQAYYLDGDDNEISSDINISGDWINNGGTFDPGTGTGTVNFINTASSTISGDTTFNNLKCEAEGKTLNFVFGSTQTIGGTLTINGTADNHITLARSGGSGSDQWNINVAEDTGTASVSYVTVSNSNAADKTIAAANSTNDDNNTNWQFAGPLDHFVWEVIPSQTAGVGVTVVITAKDASGITTTLDADGSAFTTTESVDFTSTAIASSSGTKPTYNGNDFTDGETDIVDLTTGSFTTKNIIFYNASQIPTITITHGAISKTSDAITVNPGAADNLNFVQQPTNANAAVTITPSPKVEIRDQWNNICTNDSATNITLSIGTNPGGGILSGTLTRTVSGSTATFDGLSINNAGTGYTLQASATGVTAANSSTFNIISTATPTNPVIENQISNTIVIRPVMPDLGQVWFFPINTFNPGPVYLYHPLTPSDISAFDEMFGYRGH